MGNRFIYLVRHGQYDPALKYLGPLTRRGEEQAHRTAKMLENLPINAVHCSTTLRAVQTTEIIASYLNGIEPLPSELLNECIPALTPQLADYYRTTKREADS